MKNEVISAAEPDFEIVIRTGDEEFAVFGLFRESEFVWDIVCGVDHLERRADIALLLQLTSDAIQSAHFGAVRTVETGTGDAPF